MTEWTETILKIHNTLVLPTYTYYSVPLVPYCKKNKKKKNKVTLLQARCGVEGGRGVALLFHDRGTRRGWVVSSTPRPHFTPGKHPVPILQETGWAPGPVWRGGKSRPSTIRSRTVQPVVSRYSDWAAGPTPYCKYPFKLVTGTVL